MIGLIVELIIEIIAIIILFCIYPSCGLIGGITAELMIAIITLIILCWNYPRMLDKIYEIEKKKILEENDSSFFQKAQDEAYYKSIIDALNRNPNYKKITKNRKANHKKNNN